MNSDTLVTNRMVNRLHTSMGRALYVYLISATVISASNGTSDHLLYTLNSTLIHLHHILPESSAKIEQRSYAYTTPSFMPEEADAISLEGTQDHNLRAQLEAAQEGIYTNRSPLTLLQIIRFISCLRKFCDDYNKSEISQKAYKWLNQHPIPTSFTREKAVYDNLQKLNRIILFGYHDYQDIIEHWILYMQTPSELSLKNFIDKLISMPLLNTDITKYNQCIHPLLDYLAGMALSECLTQNDLGEKNFENLCAFIRGILYFYVTHNDPVQQIAPLLKPNHNLTSFFYEEENRGRIPFLTDALTLLTSATKAQRTIKNIVENIIDEMTSYEPKKDGSKIIANLAPLTIPLPTLDDLIDIDAELYMWTEQIQRRTKARAIPEASMSPKTASVPLMPISSFFPLRLSPKEIELRLKRARVQTHTHKPPITLLHIIRFITYLRSFCDAQDTQAMIQKARTWFDNHKPRFTADDLAHTAYKNIERDSEDENPSPLKTTIESWILYMNNLGQSYKESFIESLVALKPLSQDSDGYTRDITQELYALQKGWLTGFIQHGLDSSGFTAHIADPIRKFIQALLYYNRIGIQNNNDILKLDFHLKNKKALFCNPAPDKIAFLKQTAQEFSNNTLAHTVIKEIVEHIIHSIESCKEEFLSAKALLTVPSRRIPTLTIDDLIDIEAELYTWSRSTGSAATVL